MLPCFFLLHLYLSADRYKQPTTSPPPEQESTSLIVNNETKYNTVKNGVESLIIFCLLCGDGLLTARLLITVQYGIINLFFFFFLFYFFLLSTYRYTHPHSLHNVSCNKHLQYTVQYCTYRRFLTFNPLVRFIRSHYRSCSRQSDLYHIQKQNDVSDPASTVPIDHHL